MGVNEKKSYAVNEISLRRMTLVDRGWLINTVHKENIHELISVNC